MSATQEVGDVLGRTGKGHMAHALLRSPTVLIASIGLWGMNVYVFRRFGIDHVKILQFDVRKLQQEEYAERTTAKRRGGGKLSRQSSSSATNAAVADTEMIPLTGGSSSGEQSAGDRGTEQQQEHHPPSSDNSLLLYDQEVSIMDKSVNQHYNSDDDEYYNDTARYDNEPPISSGQLICFSITLLLLLHGTYVVWIGWFGGGIAGAILAFYVAVALAVYLPLPSTRWLRHAADVILHRAYELVRPRCHYCQDADKVPRPIPFVDVFFADGMCSLSKVFFDIGMLLHMASYYPKPVGKSAWNIIIPSAFSAVPYLIRARQCLVMWSVTSLKNDPGRYQHLWNALKYCTSIFPLVLSAYTKTVSKAAQKEDLESALIVLLVINASYALWWDVVMDWGMMKTPTNAASLLCHPGFAPLPTGASSARDSLPPAGAVVTTSSCWYSLLRNRLRYGVAVSVLILLADVLLRFSWTLRFWHKPSNDSFILWSQFLEVIRRALWNLLRIEWEHMKQTNGTASSPLASTAASSNNMMMIGSSSSLAIADDSTASVGGGVTSSSSFTLRPTAVKQNKMISLKPKITTEKNAEA